MIKIHTMFVFQVKDTLFKVIIPSSICFAANIMISLFSVAAFVLRMRVWRVHHGISTDFLCAQGLCSFWPQCLGYTQRWTETK